MANISGDDLFEQKTREFKTEGAGSRRFENDYLLCINRSIGRLNSNADTATRIPQVSSRTETIQLDAMYEYVLERLLSYHLRLIGQRPQKGSEKSGPTKQEVIELIDEYRTDIQNRAYDEDDNQTMGIATS